MDKKKLFNNNWEFTKLKQDSLTYNLAKNKDIVWEKVDIPHDWMIYDTKYFYESAVGYYKKSFIVSEESLSQELFLQFDGVYMDTTIFINDQEVFEWKYGYSTFHFKINNYVNLGVNQILVRVNLQMPNSRWYSGAGIYRNVWLIKKNKLHIKHDGVYLVTKEVDDISTSSKNDFYGNSLWDLQIHVELNSLYDSLEEEQKRQVDLTYTILNKENEIVKEYKGKETQTRIRLEDVEIWDIDRPYLYTLVTRLWNKEQLVDETSTRFGCRTIRFDSNTGFYLNHKELKLKGTCEHHDLGSLGAAINKVAMKKRIEILKDMGVNSIRTAHNMCAKELLDLADEMGILINSESFDMWKKSKTTYDYARYFEEWVEKDVESWIRRDRNHPSIIMWCIGNEIYDTHCDEGGQETTKYLVELVKKHDPSGNAAITIGSNYMPWENARACADIVKLAGYNYAEKYYVEHHKIHKDWSIYGSETGSIVQSRGIYHFPLELGILCDDDEQCSSLGNSITSWGAKSIEKCITDDRDTPFSAGMYIWSGFDYIGEPTPYHTKNSYFGQIDTAGFKKDSYYVYQSAWTNYKDKAMIHIFPYWDFNQGQIIDVRVCSNAPMIELFYNEESQGIQEIDHIKGKNIVANYKIPYEKGTLTAIAYDENMEIIAVDIKESFEDAVEIHLNPDKTELIADGTDLIYVEITMKDKESREVFNANNRVFVHVTGAGRLLGLDNGDSTDFESYKGTSRKLFSGKLMAIIAAKDYEGIIRMEVRSEGMKDKVLILQAKQSNASEGISYREENNVKYNKLNTPSSPIQHEIAVRKIEIQSPCGTKLHNKLSEVEVYALIHPHNATYRDIIWRATTAHGVDSNIVSIEACGEKVKIRALGDGEFYIRAMSMNGSDKVSIISTMNFTVSGMGEAYKNPYEFISASLYSKTYGEIGSGNERGIATSRDGESIVVYDKIDFGRYGSDKIKLPIFELGSKAVEILIYEGDPRSKECDLEYDLLCNAVYHKKSIWNTYQEAEYILSRPLKGITSLAFVLKDKIHLKGFYFEPYRKSLEKLYVVDCDAIYGDSYSIEKRSINQIGNNVTITYDEMEFRKECKLNLIICGRSLQKHNTIKLLYHSHDLEQIYNLEFPYSEEFVEIEYNLEPLYGKGNIQFIFLPGSNFDFSYFQFKEIPIH